MTDTPQELIDRRRIDNLLYDARVVNVIFRTTTPSASTSMLLASERDRIADVLLPLLAEIRAEWLAPRPIEHPPTSPELQAEWDRADRSYEARKAAGDAY
jgi:hypothetical protein